MNQRQIQYLEESSPRTFSLKAWANHGPAQSAEGMEKTWKTVALQHLKTSSSPQHHRLYEDAKKIEDTEIRTTFNAVVEDRKYMATLRPLVTRDKVAVGSEQTADIEDSQKPPPSSPNNRKRPHDATTGSAQKYADQSEEATTDSVEGLPEKPSDAVETSSQVVNQRQPKRARKVNQRQSKKTSSSSTTGHAKEACAVNTLNSGIPSISETEDESQEQEDVEELIEMVKRVDHNSCSDWTVGNNECIPCLAGRYQQEAIAALRRKELKKSQPADYMILIGVFAPFNHTPLMTSVFGSRNLDSIKQALALNLDMPDDNDAAVISAVRLKMNRKEEKALDELSSVKDRRLRNMYEHLREDPPDAEETLVTNFISPILRAFVQNTDAGLVTHFPNTNSKVQKQAGAVADRPDFKLTLNGVEASFGEVTGYQQRADKGKNGFDLWRLARFGKFVLDQGVHLVPLLQIIYDQGVVYRMMAPARGVMVLAEVGLFTIPLYLNAIGNFQTSLPVLEWYKMTMLQFLADPREDRRRSWKTGDMPKIKKFLS
ncbi:hypothetical protein BGZ65_000142 [Modicella reniformis]|uniref:Uncharacterized protein n=1 Tax=Modicella reniformis TaxID=1440133 RepID=A0A9P6J5W8_9FUNG|nr:hypothetical protein BGZ65_000142 [Modicella reniformis]